ncbi:MAG: TrmH family RNA methyltransferase [Spirochaetales bacterium]|nr:TrmH family RNA methyltransferase [Spirochaetales bacterium]
MIALKKFNTLKPETKLRKYIKIFHQIEMELQVGNLANLASLHQFLVQLIEDNINQKASSTARDILSNNDESPEDSIRKLNSIRHMLIAQTGEGPADWDLDLRLPDNNTLTPQRSQGSIFCDDIRSPFNLGSIIRSCEVFQLREILISPDCPSLEHPRLRRSSMGAENFLDIKRAKFEDLIQQPQEERGTIFALETNGTPIQDFTFPQKGIVVVGSEELGVNPEILEVARNEGGIVSIPTLGNKASMNVSVAFGILASWWVLKK